MSQLAGSQKQRKFGRDKRDTLPTYCCLYEVSFVCNGECPKNRFIKMPEGESGLNLLYEKWSDLAYGYETGQKRSLSMWQLIKVYKSATAKPYRIWI